MEYIPQIYNDFNSGHIYVSNAEPTRKLIFQHTKTFGANTLKLMAFRAFNDTNINVLTKEYIKSIKTNLTRNSQENISKLFENNDITYEFESNEDPITIEITFNTRHLLKRLYFYDFHYLKSSQLTMVDDYNRVIKKINLQDVDAESSMEIHIFYKPPMIASHENNTKTELLPFPVPTMKHVDPNTLTLFKNNVQFDPLNQLQSSQSNKSTLKIKPIFAITNEQTTHDVKDEEDSDKDDHEDSDEKPSCPMTRLLQTLQSTTITDAIKVSIVIILFMLLIRKL